ncbi:hypothetical protein OIV83_003757 [Microbotryomycetes sp. JL201]|nr:hypothetical protein OIV83_003757 [Microbotryomycetes sp. JL201]
MQLAQFSNADVHQEATSAFLHALVTEAQDNHMTGVVAALWNASHPGHTATFASIWASYCHDVGSLDGGSSDLYILDTTEVGHMRGFLGAIKILAKNAPASNRSHMSDSQHHWLHWLTKVLRPIERTVFEAVHLDKKVFQTAFLDAILPFLRRLPFDETTMRQHIDPRAVKDVKSSIRHIASSHSWSNLTLFHCGDILDHLMLELLGCLHHAGEHPALISLEAILWHFESAKILAAKDTHARYMRPSMLDIAVELRKYGLSILDWLPSTETIQGADQVEQTLQATQWLHFIRYP